jgi:hypothetical protein
VLDLYQEWLTAHLGDIEGIGVYGVEGAIAELTLERRCHEGRAALVQLPLPQRVPRIWRLWASGGYRYFCGWKSAIRDLTRRT